MQLELQKQDAAEIEMGQQKRSAYEDYQESVLSIKLFDNQQATPMFDQNQIDQI